MEIKKWSDISHNYNDTILIGNGASIAVSKSFAYESLFKYLIEKKICDERVEKIFNECHTKNFEVVLSYLFNAIMINKILLKDNSEIEKYYDKVRMSLIHIIRDIHVKYGEVKCHMESISSFLKNFKTIISLNYDLILYWTIIYHKQKKTDHAFKDCYDGNKFQLEWDKYRKTIRNEKSVSLVFYLHGNIVLSGSDGNKITRDESSSNNLLDIIFNKFKSKKSIPLFVSEGDAKYKKSSINSSSYLSTIYNEVLPEKKDSLVIYGWGMGDQDEHILHKLKQADIKRIAVSVNSVKGGKEDYCIRVRQTIRNMVGENIKIEFFDAQSDNCWIYPINEEEQCSD